MVNSYIALGYKCNHNCLNCPLSTYDRLHGQLDQKVIEHNIRQLSMNGSDVHVTISGGEPTLNPSFLDVLNILGNANANITVLSNATSCQNMDFVDTMIEALGEDYDFEKFKYITAIHSFHQSVHDKLTGTPGSYLETMRGLENLDTRNIQIMIKSIMNKVTAHDMRATMEYLCSSFSNNVGFQLCSTDYSGRCRKNLEELYINSVDLQPFVEDTLDSYERNKDNCGRKLEIIETPLCLVDPYYWKYYVIHGEKNTTYIAPNAETDGNIKDEISSLCHTNYKECSDCDVRSYCSGVWESTYSVESEKEKIMRKIKTF